MLNFILSIHLPDTVTHIPPPWPTCSMETRDVKMGRESSCAILRKYFWILCVVAVIKHLAIMCGIHMGANGKILGAVSPQTLKYIWKKCDIWASTELMWLGYESEVGSYKHGNKPLGHKNYGKFLYKKGSVPSSQFVLCLRVLKMASILS